VVCKRGGLCNEVAKYSVFSSGVLVLALNYIGLLYRPDFGEFIFEGLIGPGVRDVNDVEPISFEMLLLALPGLASEVWAHQ
jgi:hypothetical protein